MHDVPSRERVQQTLPRTPQACCGCQLIPSGRTSMIMALSSVEPRES
jgi:hypothetical protein